MENFNFCTVQPRTRMRDEKTTTQTIAKVFALYQDV